MQLGWLFTIDFDNKRNYGLDILRAMAILSVMDSHSAMFLTPGSAIYNALTTLNPDGVSLFFVISGFLIGRILIEQFSQPVTFKKLGIFWARRWFRTLPNYLLILSILLLISGQTKSVTDYSNVKYYYFFLGNFKTPLPDYLFPESWSLAVEEWFYLLIPLCIFLLIAAYRFKPKFTFLVVAIGVIVFSAAFRYYRFSQWPLIRWEDIDANFRKQVITRLDSIMFGFIAAWLAYYHQTAWKKYKKLLFATGIVLLYINFTQYIFGFFGMTYHIVFAYITESIGFLCLFPLVTELKTGKGFVYQTITRISIISYSVYLVNYSLVKNYLMDILNKNLFKNIDYVYLPPIQYFSFWGITVIISILLYKYFEKPMMGLRDLI